MFLKCDTLADNLGLEILVVALAPHDQTSMMIEHSVPPLAPTIENPPGNQPDMQQEGPPRGPDTDSLLSIGRLSQRFNHDAIISAENQIVLTCWIPSRTGKEGFAIILVL